jgi:hypothetical protein
MNAVVQTGIEADPRIITRNYDLMAPRCIFELSIPYLELPVGSRFTPLCRPVSRSRLPVEIIAYSANHLPYAPLCISVACQTP